MKSTLSLGAMLVLTALACGASQTRTAPTVAMPVAKANRDCSRVHPSTTTVTPLARSRVGSTIALATLNQQTIAYTADEDDEAVHVVDVDARREIGEVPVGGRPSQLMFLPDGRLVVLLRDRGEIDVLEPGTSPGELEERCTVDVANEPVALAMTPNDATLLVTSGWGHALSAFDAAKLKKNYEVSLAREPRAVVVSDDGLFAYVSHAVGAQATRVTLADRTATAIPLRERSARDEIYRRRIKKEIADATKGGGTPPPGLVEQLDAMERRARPSAQGYALAKSLEPGGRILAPQVLVENGDPLDRRAAGYGTDEPATEQADVAVIDAATGAPMSASLVRVESHRWVDSRAVEAPPCLLPRAATVDPKTKSLLVTCVGSDQVIAYDSLAASPVQAERRRWSVSSGPTGIVVEPRQNRALVWSQFDRAIDVIDLGTGDLDEKRSSLNARIAMAPSATHHVSPTIALGRLLFHSTSDGRVARDGRACASCHPDGRDDAIVWATPDGPRRSIMLAGRLRGTAPYAWSGSDVDLRAHMATAVDRLNGIGGLKSIELDALLAYVDSLTPPQPNPVTDKAQQGASVFASAGCGSCHAGPLRTDDKRHDVGSKTDADRTADFDTPSLHLIGGGGPYFHDGRYKTLHDVLTQTGDSKMTHISAPLSEHDADTLEAYLETL